jgi:tetratricopeptide (TPR) repeat protein
VRVLLPRIPPAALAAAVLAGCAGPATLPRSVPDAGRLPADLRAGYLRALAEAASGDAAGAEKALTPLLRLRPPHVPSHLLHQDLARAAGKGEGLPADYAALAAEPGAGADADVLRTRVSAVSSERRVAAYQAAAVKDPSAPWPRIALATARAELARDLVRRAEARAREGFAADAERIRGEARVSAERAWTEGERAVALAPDLAPAQGALGHALAVAADLAAGDDRERRGLRARALAALVRSLALDPGDPRVLLDRASVLRDTGHADTAQADLDAAAAAAPRDPETLVARARNLEDLHRPEAVQAWRAAAEAAPGDPDILLDRGTALARAGRWEEALASYRAADAAYAVRRGPRWKARRGLVTALAQTGLDAGDRERLAEAVRMLRAYRAEGGLDEAWAAKMEELLAGAEPAEGAAGAGGKGATAPRR